MPEKNVKNNDESVVRKILRNEITWTLFVIMAVVGSIWFLARIENKLNIISYQVSKLEERESTVFELEKVVSTLQLDFERLKAKQE